MQARPPDQPELNIVTGAFSYSGRYITRRLLAQGKAVATLTYHPNHPDPFQERVRAYPYNFGSPAQLAGSFKGATTLYNTYWIRFPRGDSNFDLAVENTKTMIGSAMEAGVKRLVHISITNPSAGSSLAYFRGKALVEQAIMESGISYAILRSTLVLGGEDVLLNNIAWFLRGDFRSSLSPALAGTRSNRCTWRTWRTWRWPPALGKKTR